MHHRSSVPISLALLSGAAVADAAPVYAPAADSAPAPETTESERPVTPSPSTRRIPRITTSQLARVTTSDTARATAASARATTHTIYLNRAGELVTPGRNDSHAHTSSVVAHTTQVPGWNPSQAEWDATVACMREIWAPFDMAVTDVDPGITPHIEAVFARSPVDLGLTSLIGGVSPIADDCSVIENSIVFAFADNLGNDPRMMCETMSQEVAHSYGLDHELLAADPMSYLPFDGPRGFQNADASCGEFSPRPCGQGPKSCRATQNSYQLLMARLGSASGDHEPPSVAITAPAAGATVSSGFAITATASDNTGLASVEFFVDGEMVSSQDGAPYQMATDPKLTPGPHTIEIDAIDQDGNKTTVQRDIVVMGASEQSGGCSAGRSSGSGMFGLVLAALAPLRGRRRRNKMRCSDARQTL